MRIGLPKVRETAPQLAGIVPYDPKYLPARVYLSANENPYPMPEEIKAAVSNAVADVDMNRYPDPLAGDLRDRLAEIHGVKSNQVLVGNGGDELLFNIALAWGGPGRTFLNFPPTFSVYEANAKLTDTKVVQVPRQSDFTLDKQAILEVLESQEVDFCVVTNPNNPTGTETDSDFLQAAAASSNTLFVVDEAYGEFSDSTMVPYVDDFPNLIILRTFSKAYGLAGVRIGYVLGSMEVIRELIKVRQPYSVDAVSQAIALAVLENRSIYEAQVEEIKAQRVILAEQMSALEGVEVFPSQANYILFKVSKADLVWDAFYEQGILVRDFSRSLGLKDCLRVTVGTPQENEEFLNALKEALNRISN